MPQRFLIPVVFVFSLVDVLSMVWYEGHSPRDLGE